MDKEEKPLSAPNSKIEVKLFINKKEEKVVYAEAHKEFVDFLFSLVSLPLGMVIKLLEKTEMLGSIGDLYNSIKSLNKTYFQSSQNLDPILNPKPSLFAYKTPLLPTNTDSANIKAYMCPHPVKYGFGSVKQPHPVFCVADDPNTVCPSCNDKISSEVVFVPKNNPSGFVKEMVTYMVTDNLEVKPLSTVSCIALLNSSNIQDLTSLQEMVVHVGAAEGLKLLEESLQSKNVLTSVFLAKRSKRRI